MWFLWLVLARTAYSQCIKGGAATNVDCVVVQQACVPLIKARGDVVNLLNLRSCLYDSVDCGGHTDMGLMIPAATQCCMDFVTTTRGGADAAYANEVGKYLIAGIPKSDAECLVAEARCKAQPFLAQGAPTNCIGAVPTPKPVAAPGTPSITPSTTPKPSGASPTPGATPTTPTPPVTPTTPTTPTTGSANDAFCTAAHNTKSKCNKDSLCKWNRGKCLGDPNVVPTPFPTAAAGGGGAVAPNNSAYCQSIGKKNRCNNDAKCQWALGDCVDPNAPSPYAKCGDISDKKCCKKCGPVNKQSDGTPCYRKGKNCTVVKPKTKCNRLMAQAQGQCLLFEGCSWDPKLKGRKRCTGKVRTGSSGSVLVGSG